MRMNKLGNGLRRHSRDELLPLERDMLDLEKKVFGLSNVDAHEATQMAAMLSQVREHLNDFVEAKMLPAEMIHCFQCDAKHKANDQMLEWTTGHLCIQCLVKSPRLLSIAAMLWLKRKLVEVETSGQHDLDLKRNIEGLFGLLKSMVPNISPKLLTGKDKKQAETEAAFIGAGHEPSDPTCSHAVWYAIAGARPRHCPSCYTCMSDPGD